MALTYNQISAITADYFMPKLYDNVFLGNPLLRKMKDGGSYKKVPGGNKILIPLEYGEANGDWFSGSDSLNTEDSDVFSAAAVEWKQIHEPISITRRDELINSGDEAKVNFVKSKVKNAEKSMLKKLSVGLYSDGTAAKSIVGLRKWVHTTQTVGGIDQSSYSWWQGQCDTTTTTLSLGAMQTQFNAASEDSEAPNYGICTKTVYNAFYALLAPQQRFKDEAEAKAGFTSLYFNGCPIVADSNCPSAHMWFLNLNHLHLCVHRDEDMRFRPFSEPIDQAAKIAHIFWMGGLGSSNNRFHAKFTGITG